MSKPNNPPDLPDRKLPEGKEVILPIYRIGNTDGPVRQIYLSALIEEIHRRALADGSIEMTVTSFYPIGVQFRPSRPDPVED